MFGKEKRKAAVRSAAKARADVGLRGLAFGTSGGVCRSASPLCIRKPSRRLDLSRNKCVKPADRTALLNPPEHDVTPPLFSRLGPVGPEVSAARLLAR